MCVLFIAAAAGGELRGSYYTSANPGEFTTLVTTRLDSKVDFDYGTGAPPVDGIGDNLFAIRWEGTLRVSTGGAWRFYTVSDDGVRLEVDGVSVIDSWQDQAATERTGEISLSAGTHDFSLEYYENAGGAVVQLGWQGPGQPKAVMPPEAFPPPANGFTARYDTDEDPMTGPAALIHQDAQVNFNWAGGHPYPDIPADHFSVRWRGMVEAPGTGEFIFTVGSDDGNELFVDGVRLTNDFAGNHPLEEFSGTITLTQGEQYLVDLRYRENTGQAACLLYWEGPGTAGRELVPQSAVSPLDILRVEAAEEPDGATWRRVEVESTTTFGVVAEGGQGPVTYQWYFDPEGPAPRGLYAGPGANMASMTIDSVDFAHAGVYQCEVSDGVDIVDSPAFTVEVVASLPVAGGAGICMAALAAALGGVALLRRRG